MIFYENDASTYSIALGEHGRAGVIATDKSDGSEVVWRLADYIKNHAPDEAAEALECTVAKLVILAGAGLSAAADAGAADAVAIGDDIREFDVKSILAVTFDEARAA